MTAQPFAASASTFSSMAQEDKGKHKLTELTPAQVEALRKLYYGPRPKSPHVAVAKAELDRVLAIPDQRKFLTEFLALPAKGHKVSGSEI